jgi:hypothetical protein
MPAKQADPQNRKKERYNCNISISVHFLANVAYNCDISISVHFLANVAYNCDISMQAPSSTLENTTERRVLRSRVANESANANPTDQPSKGIVGYNCFRL